ncbi:MAG TPA: histidine kinase [Solirubrobacteraceae bacterium]|nr:histidine kinase [Solirubrobacteraceae bacterium]
MFPRDLISRARELGPLRRDALIGAAVTLEMQVEALFVPERGAEVHLLLLVLGLSLALRRRFPFGAFVVALVPFVTVQAYGQAVTDHLYLPLFVAVFMAYSVAANTGARRFWLAPPIAFAAGALASILDDYEGALVADLLWTGLVFVTAPTVAGRLIRNRSQLQRALREKAARLDRERAAEAERAVADERTRIAGDLHDIVAHALTEMTLQATAAGRLAERDPERARAAFAAVEDRGRDALGELRRLLGVLRHGDEELALAPQPSLRHLESLVRRAGAAGLPVAVSVEGDAVELPAGIDVTGYRVVQEALNGALRVHGAGRAEVHVRYGRTNVELSVSDDGRLVGEGPPLGLRERVALYGGELSAAPRRDGGHVVRARLPREVPA